MRPPAPLLLLTALVLAVGCGGDDDSGPEGGAVTLKAGSVLEVSAKEYSFDPAAVVLNGAQTEIVSATIPTSFGQATRTRDPRQMQIGVKLLW